jgi:hypothetical protein
LAHQAAVPTRVASTTLTSRKSFRIKRKGTRWLGPGLALWDGHH